MSDGKITSLYATAARDEAGAIKLTLTDGAASLLAHALADGHPEALDTLIGGLAAGVRPEPLKKYLDEAVTLVEGMDTKESGELVKVFMRTMNRIRTHGEQRGALVPVTPVEGVEGELECTVAPTEFYLMISSLSPDDFEESPQRVFIENLIEAGATLVEPQEKFIVMNHTAEVAQA